jgi:hypothetical protein
MTSLFLPCPPKYPHLSCIISKNHSYGLLWRADYEKLMRILAQLCPAFCRLTLAQPRPQNKARIRCRAVAFPKMFPLADIWNSSSHRKEKCKTAAFPKLFMFREVERRFLLLWCHAPTWGLLLHLVYHWLQDSLKEEAAGMLMLLMAGVSQLPAWRILQCKSEVFWEVFGL